jgi:hypothetical protein
MGSSIIVIIVKPFSFKDRDTPEPLLLLWLGLGQPTRSHVLAGRSIL